MFFSVHISLIGSMKKFFICMFLIVFCSSSNLLAMSGGARSVVVPAIRQGLGSKVVSFLKRAACLTEAVAETSVKGFTQKTCPLIQLTQGELASGVRELAKTYAGKPFQPLAEALLKESVENATLHSLAKVENESVFRLRTALENHIQDIKKPEPTGFWRRVGRPSTREVPQEVQRALEVTNLDVRIKNLIRLPEGKIFLEGFLDVFKKEEPHAWQEIEVLLENRINDALSTRVKMIQSLDVPYVFGATEQFLVDKNVIGGRVQGIAQSDFLRGTFSSLGGKELSGLVGDTVALAPLSLQTGSLTPTITEVVSQPLASKVSIIGKIFEEEAVSKAQEISSVLQTAQKTSVPRPFGGLQPFSTPATALQKYSQPLTAFQKIPQPALTQPSMLQPTLLQPTLLQPTLAQPALAQPTLAQPTLAQPTLPQVSESSLIPFVPQRSALTAPALAQPSALAIVREPVAESLQLFSTPFTALQKYSQASSALQKVSQPSVRSLAPFVPKSSAFALIDPVSSALVPFAEPQQALASIPVKVSSLAPFIPQSSALAAPVTPASLAIVPTRVTPATEPIGLVKKTVPLIVTDQPAVSMLSKSGLWTYFDPRTIVAATKFHKDVVLPQEAIVPFGVPTAQEILAGVGDRSLVEGYAPAPITDPEASFLGGMLNALSKIINAAPGKLAPITIPDVVASKVLALGAKHNLALVWVRQDCLPVGLLLEGPSSILTDAKGGVISVLGHTGSKGYLPMALRQNLLTQFEEESQQLALDLPSVVAQNPLVATEVRVPTMLDPIVVPEESGESTSCVQPMFAVDSAAQDELPLMEQSWSAKILAGVQRQAAILRQLSPDDAMSGVQRLTVSLLPPTVTKYLAGNTEKIAALKEKYPLLKMKKLKETMTEKLVKKEDVRLLIVAKIRAEEVVEKDLINAWMKDGGPNWKITVSPSARRIKEKKEQAHDLFDAYNGLLALRGKDLHAQESLERLKLTILAVLGEESENRVKILAGIRERLNAALVKKSSTPQRYYGKV